MTKTWALTLLAQGYYSTTTSKAYPELTERDAHIAVVKFLALCDDADPISAGIALIVRRVVQNRIDPITRFEWVSQYANIMHKRIIGECNIDYCTESAQNAMQELASGEWMVVSPTDAVRDEMECWDD